jgi:dipeptide transport system permease protein
MAAAAETRDELRTGAAPVHPVREFWYYFSENTGAVIGLATVLAIVAVAILADQIAPHPPIEQYRDFLLLPPAWLEGGDWSFVLGTDATGRDILSRLMHGSRYSLFVGVMVITLSLSSGVSLGLIAAYFRGPVEVVIILIAAYFRGPVEVVIMRLMDVILAIPSLLLALVIVAILGPSLRNAMIAIAVVFLPHFVRLSRASAITEMTKDYVTASRVAGAGRLRLMAVTVLPNCMAPLIVQATLGFSTAILDAAALGFLGMGAQPPTPEWGTMLADAREFILRAWWVVTFPGLAILIAVLAFNIMGDGLRDALDPKMKRS